MRRKSAEPLVDTHLHTRHSRDSRARPEEYVCAAAAKGAKAICFTDHVDNNPADEGYRYYDPPSFFRDYYRAKDAAGGIRVLSGIEFAEPHQYPAELARLKAYPYDYILGTVHYWHKDRYPSAMLRAGVSADVCYRQYWQAVLDAVTAGGFDSLGHMDFPKRYYRRLLYRKSVLRAIFERMVEKAICLEINTSTLRGREALGETMPGRELLALYAQAGGRDVTIGSDAHRPEDLAAGRTHAVKLAAEFGLREVIYMNRQRIGINDL